MDNHPPPGEPYPDRDAGKYGVAICPPSNGNRLQPRSRNDVQDEYIIIVVGKTDALAGIEELL
jgi:hypothetical protein